MSCFDLTHAPVATAARAAATGLVSMSTRPGPEGSGTVEIATRRCPRLRVVWDLRELTHQQKPRLWSLPARLGPVTVHPTRWGVGPTKIAKSKLDIVFGECLAFFYRTEHDTACLVCLFAIAQYVT